LPDAPDVPAYSRILLKQLFPTLTRSEFILTLFFNRLKYGLYLHPPQCLSFGRGL